MHAKFPIYTGVQAKPPCKNCRSFGGDLGKSRTKVPPCLPFFDGQCDQVIFGSVPNNQISSISVFMVSPGISAHIHLAQHVAHFKAISLRAQSQVLSSTLGY